MEEGTGVEISTFMGITEASMEEIASISVDLKRLRKATNFLNEEKAKMIYVDTFFHVLYKAATDEYEEKRKKVVKIILSRLINVWVKWIQYMEGVVFGTEAMAINCDWAVMGV
jgi:predicted transcriptional regulator